MKFGLLLIMWAFASKENEVESTKSEEREMNDENLILVKIEEDEFTKLPKKTSKYIGVFENKRRNKWCVSRHSKLEKKNVYNGTYKDEETAAHASDTLARKLMANGEQNHKLNFPNEINEVYAEKDSTSSKYIGVNYHKRYKTWRASRHSKDENKIVYNGSYKDEETAAHASDTLARKLMTNGEQNHKLSFPNEINEVYAEKESTSSKFIGVSYNKRDKMWYVSRHSKDDNKIVHNGTYKGEETAAHASDTLARKLMENGEQNHKLNFPNDTTEVYHERHKRKRSDHNNLGHSESK